MADERPKICFIDAATKYGVAIGRPGEQPLSWSGRFGKEGASQGAVSWAAMSFISGLMRDHKPDCIVVEAPLPASIVNGKTNLKTQEVLMGLPFAIQGIAFGLRCFDVSVARVSKIRAHFIGRNMKGDVAKPIVWRKCVDLGWINPDDEDLSYDRSDALAGWSYAEHIIAPKLATPVDDLVVASVKRKRLAEAAAREQARQSCQIPETF